MKQSGVEKREEREKREKRENEIALFLELKNFLLKKHKKQ